jgi:hypothetical protein
MDKPTLEELQFQEAMKERHKEALADFGVPEQLIEEQDVKMFRFSAQFELKPEHKDLVFFNPMPVYSYLGTHIGFANVYPTKGLWFDVRGSIDYHSYERMDYETGRHQAVVPYVQPSGRIALMMGDLKATVTGTVIDKPLTLYVDTTGNDLNPGTADKPFKTIQAAIDSLDAAKPALWAKGVAITEESE